MEITIFERSRISSIGDSRKLCQNHQKLLEEEKVILLYKVPVEHIKNGVWILVIKEVRED